MKASHSTRLLFHVNTGEIKIKSGCDKNQETDCPFKLVWKYFLRSRSGYIAYSFPTAGGKASTKHRRCLHSIKSLNNRDSRAALCSRHAFWLAHSQRTTVVASPADLLKDEIKKNVVQS